VAVASAVMLGGLTSRLAAAFPNRHVDASSLLSPSGVHRSLPASSHDAVAAAFAGALHSVFVLVLLVVVLGAFSVLMMPRGSAIELRDRMQGEFLEEVEAHPEEIEEFGLAGEVLGPYL
jgi:hypothetical protein